MYKYIYIEKDGEEEKEKCKKSYEMKMLII